MKRFFTIIVTLILCLIVPGCRKNETTIPIPYVARFYVESQPHLPHEWSTPICMPISQTLFNVYPKPVILEGDIENIELVQVDLGQCLLFEFNQSATQRLHQLSQSNSNETLFLFINDVPVGFQTLQEPIQDGKLILFVEIADKALPDLVLGLKKSLSKIKAHESS